MTKSKKPTGEHAQPSTANVATTKQAPSKPSFHVEILSMMSALGDGPKPLQRTAVVIEEIVHRQMVPLLVQAADMSVLRSARLLTIEDVFFLLRHRQDKIWRITTYLCNKEAKLKACESGEEPLDLVDEYNKAMGLQSVKRKCLAMDFLSTAENPTGDVEKWIFGGRNESLVKSVGEPSSAQECFYLDILDAHSITFGKRPGKLRDWLECSSLLDIKPSTLAMEALAALAADTVIELVNSAMAVRQEQFDRRHFSLSCARSSRNYVAVPSSSHQVVSGKGDCTSVSTTAVDTGAVLQSSNSKPVSGPSIAPGKVSSLHLSSESSTTKVSITVGSLTSALPGSTPLAATPATTSASSSTTVAGAPSTSGGSLAGQFAAASRTAIPKTKKKPKTKTAHIRTMPPIPLRGCGALTPADVREALRRDDRLSLPFYTVHCAGGRRGLA